MKGTPCLLVLLTCSLATEWQKLGSYEYFFSQDYENGYESVVEACNKQQASLVLIKTEEVQNFVLDLTTNLASAVVIGLIRVSSGNLGFLWIDGTNVTEAFTFWADDEPNNDNQKCVLMTGLQKGRWKDHSCGGPMQFICQRRIDSTTEAIITTANGATTKINPAKSTFATTSQFDISNVFTTPIITQTHRMTTNKETDKTTDSKINIASTLLHTTTNEHLFNATTDVNSPKTVVNQDVVTTALKDDGTSIALTLPPSTISKVIVGTSPTVTTNMIKTAIPDITSNVKVNQTTTKVLLISEKTTTFNFGFTTNSLNPDYSKPTLQTTNNTSITSSSTSTAKTHTTIINRKPNATDEFNTSFRNYASSISLTTMSENTLSSTQFPLTITLRTLGQTQDSNISQNKSTEKTTTLGSLATNRDVWKLWQVAVASASGSILLLMIIITLSLLCMDTKKNAKRNKKGGSIDLDLNAETESFSIQSKSLVSWPGPLLFGDYKKNQEMFPRPTIVISDVHIQSTANIDKDENEF